MVTGLHLLSGLFYLAEIGLSVDRCRTDIAVGPFHVTLVV